MINIDEIRDFSRRNGIHAIGWFAAGDFSQYMETLCNRIDYHEIDYRPLSVFINAGHIPEGIRTVIVLIMDYFVESSDQSGGCRLSNYARACWSTLVPKMEAVADFLKTNGCRAEILDIPQRAAACRAGLGFIGRNTMFYGHELGSYVGIASIGTNALLEETGYWPERITHPQCDKCDRCISACPAGAIPPDGYQIKPLRCLSFVNRHPDEPLRIMPRKSEQLDKWLYGCEACQNVCPLNNEANHKHEAVVPSEISIEGMTIPNTAFVPEITIKSRQNLITSPGYREYIRKLIDKDSGQNSALHNL